MISVEKCQAEEQLFHNEKINVYPKNVSFEDIEFWPENLRTLLAFEVLSDKKNISVEKMPLEDVTDFLAKRSELELSKLAKNIERNGVRVPIIMKTDGTLLDGNRRYFACSVLYHRYKKEGKEVPEVLKNIPAWIVKNEDLDIDRERKILAEANFVKDLKVSWSLDVKAMLVNDLHDELIQKGKSEDEAYLEIENIYSLKKSDAKSYIETIIFAKEYIERAEGNKDKEFKLRETLLNKFVYFWEFRNKALTGRGKLDDVELEVVKPLFFEMIEHGRFKNIKQIEPMIRSYRESDLWSMLTESKGIKIDEAVIFYNERKTIKSSEDKVRNFLKWMKKEKERNLTNSTYRLLDELKNEIDGLLKERG